MIKDLLGDESSPLNASAKEIQTRLNIALTSGEDVVVDLRANNGRKPVFDSFWDIVANHIEEVTALNDRRWATVTEDEVVVNMALAGSYADLY